MALGQGRTVIEMGLFGKKYKCSTCGASFKSEQEMMTHSRVHMQQASPKTTGFACAGCNMSFPTEMELRQHNQRVHGM